MGHYLKTKHELNQFFSEEYYNSINYTDYRFRIQKYEDTSKDLANYLQLNINTRILDYGCAVGMLLNGFFKMGFENLTGYDISEWAVKNSINLNLNLSTDAFILKKSYDVIFSLDVFEHMFDEDIDNILSKIDVKSMIVRIPVKIVGDSDFYLEVSRRDKSHINCKTKGEWIDFIEKHGYRFINVLELSTIYDSKGCFCGYFIKE